MLVSRRYAEWPVLKRPQMAGFEVSTKDLNAAWAHTVARQSAMMRTASAS
jgi:hypothetical protein